MVLRGADLNLNAMNPLQPFVSLSNCSSLPLADIPAAPIAQLVSETAKLLAAGCRLCSWFGMRCGEEVTIISIVADDCSNILQAAKSIPFSGGYQALTPSAPQAHLFEREVWEQLGIVPDGHPWLKPVRSRTSEGPAAGRFFQVEGHEVHEVAVGPVHAGVIEPGHFRFQCAGEEVLHLEIALGYQHRGIEPVLVGGPNKATLSIMETVAGDATIAHATAYASVLEALADAEAPLRAQWLRAIALELERLANHTGDLGALANDVAFLPTSSACGKLRGDFLNMTALLCGNRFGRSLVTPGGCRKDLDPARAVELEKRLKPALVDVAKAADWLWDCSSVRARFERVGVVTTPQAVEIGMVGPAARASGLVRDVRYDHPAGWHRFAQSTVALWPGGDVFARARVRWLEIQRSGNLILEQLAAPPEGQLLKPVPSPAPASLAVALVESWRGEVCHVAITNDDGHFARYKITDPSFHNWTGLAMALRGQAVYDFPICNKSFNLSYCGFDL
jgi:Ni,Fe-hydrogenase III large subunit